MTKSKTKQNRGIIATLKLWTKRRPYLASFLLGSAYFTLVVSWMFTIKTAEIAGGNLVKIVAFTAGMIMVTSFALGFVVFVFIYRFLKIRLNDNWALLLVPAAWVVSEYLRAIIFSISSLGPGGRIGPYWTFGNLGYYLAETPLAYVSRFGGLYLLSGIVALVVVASYQSYKRKSALRLAIVLLCVMIFSGLGFYIYGNSTGPTRNIGAVHYAKKNTPTVYSSESYGTLNSIEPNSLDILVLPEYSYYFEENSETDTSIVKKILKSDDGLVIHSAKDKELGIGHNLITFQSANGTVLDQQKKWFVVPAGEYVPYIYQLILAYVGKEDLIKSFNDQKTVNRGEKIEHPFIFDEVSYGAYACSGVMSPEFYNQLAAQGASIFTNSAALDSMGISPLFHVESKTMNKLSAIANARPFVQSAKGGPAYIINKDGKIYSYDDNNEGGVALASVEANTTRTAYSYLGEWVVALSFVITIVAFTRQLSVKKPNI